MINEIDPNQENVITVMPRAHEHFRNYLKNYQDAIGIQLSIEKTGCSGLSYVVQPVENEPANHEILTENGITFYLDKKALPYIKGLALDYVKQDFGFSKLVYHNPNEKARCGCGESFTVNEVN
jgi:iron-sulfur cluster assembly protein